MIQYINGNILDAKENIIVQSVNHQGVMGGGLALQIKNKYPEIDKEGYFYQSMCKTMTFEEIKQEGLIAYYSTGNQYIASIFGQDQYGRDKQYTDYVALGNGLNTVKLFAENMLYSIAIPSGLGCGLGGGDWQVVEDIIQRCFSESIVHVWIYRYQNMLHSSP